MIYVAGCPGLLVQVDSAIVSEGQKLLCSGEGRGRGHVDRWPLRRAT